MNFILLASLSLTLLLAIAALVREVRLRRALQTLLHYLLKRWRTHGTNHLPPQAMLSVLAVISLGCDHRDPRLAEFAAQSTQSQARQNEVMAQLNRDVAAGNRQLVEAQREAAGQLLTLHSQWQQRHTELAAERREIDQDRLRESVLGPLISVWGLALVSLLPLLVCWRLLSRLPVEPSEQALCELLIDEIEHQQECSRVPVLAESRPTAIDGPAPTGGTTDSS